MTTPLTTPPEVRLVLTREAAKILGMSMKQVRSIATAGKIKSWSLGPKSFAYDIEEVKRYKAEKEAGRRAGKVRGSRPQGFSAHVSPPNRAKKKK
jgi:predicted DNA-binding transcriptional regulator AlpA